MNREFPLPERFKDGTLPKYAFPGGYPLYYLAKDNAILCGDCAIKCDKEREENPDLAPVNCDANWEDTSLYCDECYQRIESAYGEEDESDEAI